MGCPATICHSTKLPNKNIIKIRKAEIIHLPKRPFPTKTEIEEPYLQLLDSCRIIEPLNAALLFGPTYSILLCMAVLFWSNTGHSHLVSLILSIPKQHFSSPETPFTSSIESVFFPSRSSTSPNSIHSVITFLSYRFNAVATLQKTTAMNAPTLQISCLIMPQRSTAN